MAMLQERPIPKPEALFVYLVTLLTSTTVFCPQLQHTAYPSQVVEAQASVQQFKYISIPLEKDRDLDLDLDSN